MDLDDLTPEQREDVAHAAVCSAGFAFTQALWGERSLTLAWPVMDPVLRRCLAQAWLHGQQDHARRMGMDPDDIVEAFAADRPEHPLWCVFEELQLPDLLAWKLGAHEWCATARHHPLALDVELLYMVPPTEDGLVSDVSVFLPLVMSYDQGGGGLAGAQFLQRAAAGTGLAAPRPLTL
ncbi:hypothetical protein ACIP2Y_18200 [Streptomyces sviceus]|uniref:hypothetical protein n=1 Tax=Streptomyces sviceus TaxID=285530 RepID=UPI00382E7934